MICLLFSIPSLEQKWTQGGSIREGAAGSTEPWDRQALFCFGTGTDLLYILTLHLQSNLYNIIWFST